MPPIEDFPGTDASFRGNLRAFINQGDLVTTQEAAAVIGITAGTLRQAIRNGKIKAKRVKIPQGYAWDISTKEAERYRDNPSDSRGWVRGRFRK